MIGDKQVIEIIEEADHYVIMGKVNDEGAHIAVSTVQKSAPCIVDWTDVYEVPILDLLDEGAEVALIHFGNYLLEKYNVKVMSDDGTNQPLYDRKVTDADIQNWKHHMSNELTQH